MSGNWVKISNAHYVNLNRIDKIRFMQEGGTLTATIWYIFGDQSEMFRDQEARILKEALDQLAYQQDDSENSHPPSVLEQQYTSRYGTHQT